MNTFFYHFDLLLMGFSLPILVYLLSYIATIHNNKETEPIFKLKMFGLCVFGATFTGYGFFSALFRVIGN